MKFGMITETKIEKSKIMLMDTGSFIVYIKIEDIYSEIVKDVERKFDT